MFTKASLSRVVCVLLVLSSALGVWVGSTSADYAKCYHGSIPTTNDGYLLALFDELTSADIVVNLNNGSDSTLEFNIAVTKSEIAGIFTGQSIVAFDFFEQIILGGGEIKEVPYDGYCRGAILDGRLNKYDLGALAYVYTENDGYAVWELDLTTMEGYRAFGVTRAAVNEALEKATATGVSWQIGVSSDRGTALFGIPGGQCQMNHFEQDGKLNEFVFDCA